MTSRTHDVFAVASLITVATYYPPPSINLITLITSSIGCIVGALLPDIDQETNRLWDLIPAGHLIGDVLGKLFLAHRTLSHSVLGVFIVYKLLGLLLPKLFNSTFINVQILFASIMIGYLSHLLADALTEEGLPLFFPIKWKIGFPPIKPWRIKTGGWFEKFVVFPSVIAYIVWFVSVNQDKIFNNIKLIIK